MKIGLDFLSDISSVSSGVITYVYGFLNALAALPESKENEYYLFVNSGNIEVFKNFDSSPFHLVHFPGTNKLRELRVLTQMILVPYYSRKFNLDAIDFFGTTGSPGLSCAVVQHVKSLHHILVPDQLDRYTILFRNLAIRMSIHRANIILANSKFTMNSIRQYFKVPEECMRVVPEAVDMSTFCPINGKNDRYEETLKQYHVQLPYILFVSTLWPYKNAESLIRAFTQLMQDSDIQHNLVMVGGDWHNEHDRLNTLSKKLGIDKRVQFIGHVAERNRVRDLYVGADVFVYPSKCETFGLTLLEAMACGVPVVASNLTSVPETAGNAAIIINPDDIDELSGAILKVISDRVLRNELVSKGFDRVQHFTWKTTALGTLNSWKRAIEIHNRR